MHVSVETYCGIQGLHMTGVTFFVDELAARPDLEVFDFPRILTPSTFSTGLTMVRRRIVASGNVGRNPQMPGYELLRAGVALFNDGAKHKALKEFVALTESQPSFATAWLLRGTALVTIGAINQGLDCLERAHSLGHGRARPLIEAIRRELGPNKVSSGN
jgi:hypothetical protein